MSKHTPGPWSIWKNGQTIDGPRSADGGRKIVAVAQGDSAEEQDANARLIASAPETAAERDELKEAKRELVAALENIVAWMEQHHPEAAANIPVTRATLAKHSKGE